MAADYNRPGPLKGMILQEDAEGRGLHFHEPLENPHWLTATDDAHMYPEDPVVGLVVGPRAYAIPWWVLKNYHLANLVLEGEPIMVVL